MKMFKCSHCGKVFEEVGTYKDGHDTRCCCPECGFDGYEEAVKCEVCGEWFTEDELFYDICEDCKINLVAEHKYDYKKCYELSKEETEEIKINSFLTSRFTPEIIEKILMKQLSEFAEIFPIDCTNFINSDIAWFIEKAKGVTE